MPKATVTLKHLHHRGGDQIGIYFDYNAELIAEVKKLNGVRWSAGKRCWYVPSGHFSISDFFNKFKSVAFIDYSGIKNTTNKSDSSDGNPKQPRLKSNNPLLPETVGLIERFKKWMKQQRYAENTMNSYINQITRFLQFFSNKTPGQINHADIEKFNYDFVIVNARLSDEAGIFSFVSEPDNQCNKIVLLKNAQYKIRI